MEEEEAEEGGWGGEHGEDDGDPTNHEGSRGLGYVHSGGISWMFNTDDIRKFGNSNQSMEDYGRTDMRQ